MHLIFPNAGNYQAHQALFIGIWKVWFKRFSPSPDAWRQGTMPIAASSHKLYELLEQDHRFSLEVACRLIIPWSYRNQQQVDKSFFVFNSHFVKPLDSEQAISDVLEVRLTDQALAYWDELSYMEQDLYLSFAEARVQADIETPSDQPVIIDDAGIDLIGEDIYPPVMPNSEDSDESFIRALVAWVDEDPFQPMYQRQAVGDAVSGWADRLLCFFWPKPRSGYMEYSVACSPLLYRIGVLARILDGGGSWSHQEQIMAEKTANEVFRLAGVPQRQVTWENIEKVIQTALNARENTDAKMNSGWTYLSCLATAHLEQQEGRLPLASYNSRVANSIISRLDFLLVETQHKEVGDRFPGIGTIPGWGGTRPRPLSLNWPNGYRSWKTQIEASRMINKMAEILNTEKSDDGKLKYSPMPLPGGGRGLWTARGVQLVLFSDGY